MSDKETDWELKDRRMAWMNINSASSVITAARINAGLFKPKTMEEAITDNLRGISIEYEAYLKLSSGDVLPHGGGESKPKKKEQEEQRWDYFCLECGRGVSERVKEFSEDKFGQVLCYSCQDKARAKIEQATSQKDLGK